MSERAVAVKLTVKDQEAVLAALRAVGKGGEETATRLEASFRRVEAASTPLNRAIAGTRGVLAELQGPVQQITGNFFGLGGVLGGLVTSFGGVAIAVGVLAAGFVALFEQAKKQGQWAEDLTKFAKAVDATTGEIQAWEFAAKAANLEVGNFRQGLKDLQAKVFEAERGLGRAKEVFKVVGLEIHDAGGRVRPTLEILRDLMAILQQYDRADRLTILRRLGAVELAPLLREGPEAVDRLLRKFGELELEIGKGAVVELAKVNKELRELETVHELKIKKAFSDFAPVLLGVKLEMFELGLEMHKFLARILQLKLIGDILRGRGIGGGPSREDVEREIAEKQRELEEIQSRGGTGGRPATPDHIAGLQRRLEELRKTREKMTEGEREAERFQRESEAIQRREDERRRREGGPTRRLPNFEELKKNAGEIENILRKLEREADAAVAALSEGPKEAAWAKLEAQLNQLRAGTLKIAEAKREFDRAWDAQGLKTLKDYGEQSQQLARIAEAEAAGRKDLVKILELEAQLRKERGAEFVRDNKGLIESLARERLEIERNAERWRALRGEIERGGDAIGRSIEDSIIASLERTGDTMQKLRDIWKRVALDIAGTAIRLTVTNPATNALFGTNRPALDFQGFFGGGGSPFFDLGKQLSGSTLFGRPLLGSALSPDQIGAAEAGASALGTTLPGGFGQAGWLNMAGTAAGGAFTGFGIGSMVSSLFPKTFSSIGSQIGGSIGGLAGGIAFGPLGALAGSLLGSVIGGLFGNKRPSVGPGANAALTHIAAGDVPGRVVVQGVGSDNGGDANAARAFGEGLATAMNRLVKELGLEGARAGGVGAAVTPSGFRTTIGLETLATGTDAEATIRSTLYAMLRQEGRFFDLPAEIERVVTKSSATDLEGLLGDIEFAKNLPEIVDGLEAAGDALKEVEVAARNAAREQVKGITDFVDKANELGYAAEGQRALERLVDQLLDFSAQPEDVSEAARALAALAASLEVVRENADKLQLTETRIAEAEAAAREELRKGFDEGIAKQILAILDPVAAALAEFDEAAARRLEDARLLGANLVEVERLNALERQRIAEQAANASTDTLRSFFEEVMFGPLGGASPGVSLEGRRASFSAAAAQAIAGDFTARGRLPELGRSFLEASRNYFGSSEGFQADREAVLAAITPFLTANDNAVVAAITATGAEQVRVLQKLLDEVAALRATTVAQAAEIASLNSRLGRAA